MPSSPDTTRRSGVPHPKEARGAPPAPGGLDRELVELDPDQRAQIEVLIVDDEHSLREGCATLLRSDGYKVTVEGDGEEALGLIRSRRFDILLFDLYMSDVSGMELLEEANRHAPDSLVILMTGNPSVETSIRALRQGAWDYLPKPFSANHFQVLLGRAAHTVVVARESASTEETPDREASSEPSLRTRSPSFQRAVEVAKRVAMTDASVFLTGESGAGKEVIARFIHQNSRRRSRPLIPVNCAAIPEALLESEMFGHVEGAFTGAVRDKEGLLEAANGGTLFLDELTELPLPTQAKLLRVLQDGVVRRVGSVKADAVVNVRFIAATNRDPAEAIKDGTLRKDLHYRLRVVPIHVPPLRERREDIPELVEDFLSEFWQRHRAPGSPQPHLSESAMRALQRAPFPGNVRELRNVIEHMVVLVDAGATVEPDDIPFHENGEAGSESMGGAPFASVLSLGYHEARERILNEFEIRYLRHVVDMANGNVSDAARIAGVDRTTLYRLMEKHETNSSRLSADEDGGS
jgi:DNA-binding NtrC family response regulator